MLLSEAKRFELFLMESFGDGVNTRELRLSNEEAELVKNRYPEASLKRYQMHESPDGKSWYKVTLSPSIINESEIYGSKEFVAIQKENILLKQELDVLKKSGLLANN